MTLVNILKFTQTEEFSYDRDQVHKTADWLAEGNFMVIHDWMTLDDIIHEVFELTYDSQLGNELFYGLGSDCGYELLERSDDE